MILYPLILGLDKETCLIPVPPQQPVESAQSYSLLTENLILTQLTLHLGFHRYMPSNTHQHNFHNQTKESICFTDPHRNVVYCMFLMLAPYVNINPCCLVLFASTPVRMHNVHVQTPWADGEDESISPPAPGDVAGGPANRQPNVGAAPWAVWASDDCLFVNQSCYHTARHAPMLP